jgi:hypothetical protein
MAMCGKKSPELSPELFVASVVHSSMVRELLPMLWALAVTHAGNHQKEDQDRMPIPVDGQRVAKRLETWAALRFLDLLGCAPDESGVYFSFWPCCPWASTFFCSSVTSLRRPFTSFFRSSTFFSRASRPASTF